MTPIIGLDGYFVQGFEIIGKHGRPLKADRRNVYSFRVGGRAYHAELHKVVWCARHRVNVMDVPKDYSFREVNGTIMVETFSDRMSNTRKALAQEVKVKREDYDFIETFARMAKGLLDGEPDAKAKIFSLLNSKRDECVRYARTASGGVSQQKAVLYTDKAILKVFEQVCTGVYAVASPIASIKWHINHSIRNGRKKRSIDQQKQNEYGRTRDKTKTDEDCC